MSEAINSSRNLCKTFRDYSESINYLRNDFSAANALEDFVYDKSTFERMHGVTEILFLQNEANKLQSLKCADTLRFFSQPCMEAAQILIDKSKSLQSPLGDAIVPYSKNLMREWDHLRRTRHEYMLRTIFEIGNAMSQAVRVSVFCFSHLGDASKYFRFVTLIIILNFVFFAKT
jgi:hypothetical protein